MSEVVLPEIGRCPVCSARFRGERTCSRCGADLSAVMRAVAQAWQSRRQCREALLRGELGDAVRWARAARRLVGACPTKPQR